MYTDLLIINNIFYLFRVDGVVDTRHLITDAFVCATRPSFSSNRYDSLCQTKVINCPASTRLAMTSFGLKNDDKIGSNFGMAQQMTARQLKVFYILLIPKSVQNGFLNSGSFFPKNVVLFRIYSELDDL